MRIRKNALLCRKPAGRCAKVIKVDRRNKKAFMDDIGHGRFWVSFDTLKNKWRLPGRA